MSDGGGGAAEREPQDPGGGAGSGEMEAPRSRPGKEGGVVRDCFGGPDEGFLFLRALTSAKRVGYSWGGLVVVGIRCCQPAPALLRAGQGHGEKGTAPRLPSLFPPPSSGHRRAAGEHGRPSGTVRRGEGRRRAGVERLSKCTYFPESRFLEEFGEGRGSQSSCSPKSLVTRGKRTSIAL